MSQPLVVSIPHQLGKEQAIGRLKSGLARAAETIPILKVEDERWTGDNLTFRVSALGQTAHGTAVVGDDHVRVEVVLPWMLQRFGEALQRALGTRARILLEKK